MTFKARQNVVFYKKYIFEINLIGSYVTSKEIWSVYNTCFSKQRRTTIIALNTQVFAQWSTENTAFFVVW